jgi:predicted  nucleic acid-binding Zn-ribbon protein
VDETEELRALMQADRWIERVASQREHLPEMTELAALEGNLRSLSKALEEAKNALSPVRSSYEAVERETSRLAKRGAELERTLAASTANVRELTVLHAELEHVRELLALAEDRELELLIEVEPLDEQVAAIKGQAQPGLVRRGELQGIIAELQASLDEELVALRRGRDEAAGALSSELAARYEGLKKRVGTSGAAQVDEGRCDGCRIALSPLDLSRYKAQPAGEFMTCAECGRLLVP